MSITYFVEKPYTPPAIVRSTDTFKPYVDFDLDIEAAVLGICINESSALGSVYNLLSEDCFFCSAHLEVYRGLKFLFENGYPIDGIILNSIMNQKGITELKGVYDSTPGGTMYFLCRLSYGVLTSAHLETWCLLLRQLAAHRLMMLLTTSGGGSGTDVFQAAGEIDKMLKRILEVRTTNDWHHISEVGIKTVKEIESRDRNKLPGVTTSISLLDKLNGGFRPGDLVVVGARPSVGKSAFMGRIATHSAMKGAKVGIISLEMEDTAIFTRMLSADSETEFNKIDRNDFGEENERARVYNALSSLSTLPIYFSDTSQVNIFDIRGKADKLQRKHGLDILIVDYLQLIEPENEKGRNREQEVAKMSRGLKLLAKTLHIPIVLLAQLNRAVMEKGDNKPQLHHLRESGAIEQDADVVMFIHRDSLIGIEQNADGGSTEFEADLLVRKWRNGAPMEIKIGFEPTQMRFFDPETERLKNTPEFKSMNPGKGITGVYRTIPTSSQDSKEEMPF